MILKRTKLFLKSCSHIIFCDKIYLYLSFLFGFPFDCKNRITSIICRLYCLSYSICVIIHFIGFVYMYRLDWLFAFIYWILFDAYVFILVIYSFFNKQVHILKYLKGAEDIITSLKYTAKQTYYVSYSAILIQLLAIFKIILTYYLCIHTRILPFNLNVLFGVLMLNSSFHIPCISIVLVYDLLWRQLTRRQHSQNM